MDTTIERLAPAEFRERLPEALAVYVAAMQYSPQVLHNRAPAWSEHSRREWWSCQVALGSPRRRLLGGGRPPLVGVCYGYRGSADQWWFRQVDRGLRAGAGVDPGIGSLAPGYVELTELHVSPDHQGRGIGRRLLRSFLAERTEPRVLLSTPEVPDEDNQAWHLYRSEGFTDVLRGFRFDGDPRPFAVLGRELPLPEADRTPDPNAGPEGDSGANPGAAPDPEPDRAPDTGR